MKFQVVKFQGGVVLFLLFILSFLAFAGKSVLRTNWYEPLAKSLVETSTQNFAMAYKTGVNDNISNVQFNVDWDDISDYVDTSYMKLNGYGLAFHYILEGQPGSQYFSYALTLALQDTSGIHIRSFEKTSKYLVFTQTGIDSIESTQLQGLKDSYQVNVKVNDYYPSSNIYYVSSFNHPNLSYFSPNNFIAFLQQTDSTGMEALQLNVWNGTQMMDSLIQTSTGQRDTMEIQSPVLIWGTTSGLKLNNETFNLSKPYSNRAIDNSKKSPPY